jgi:hypothetical protein
VGTVDLSQWQAPLTSTSGLTVVKLPRQAVSGGRLLVQVRTVPQAHVSLTLGFPDGTSLVARCHASSSGDAGIILPLDYQPQGSAEAATVTVEAVLRSARVDDVVQGSVAVLQHIVLQGYLRLPRSVVVGHWLTVTVVCNQPGAYARFLLVYPDKQVESGPGGYTNAAGALTRRFAVARSDGTRGTLTVQVWLSYSGAQLRMSGRVALRARNS